MRTTLHSALLADLSIVEAAERVIAAGYDSIEPNAENLPWAAAHVSPDTPAEVRRALRAAAPTASVAAHGPGLASPDDATRTAAVAWTVGLAQLAHDLECDLIHVIPGDEPEGGQLGVAGGPSDLGAFRRSLEEVVTESAALGVRVGLEPIVNQLVSRTDQVVELLNQLPELWVSFDPSHLQVTTGDLDDAVRRLGSRTVNLAIKDARGVPDDFVFPRLGTGDIAFVALIRGLRAQGYDGIISVEHESHLFGDERSPEQAMVESLAEVQELLAAAGV